MSNAMSISKSRWKGALLATVAASVLTPLAANAQTTSGSMTLSLSLAPMANVISGASFGTSEYIAPDEGTIPIYVYATVTQASPIASNNVAGLQYAYFNVLQNYSANYTGVNALGINNSDGNVVSAQTSPLFSAYGSQNGVSGATSGYYAVGAGENVTSQSYAIGQLAPSSTMSLMGKARSTSPVWSNSVSGTGDGTNVYISGNTVSFLVETLQYQPNWVGNPKLWNDPSLGENTFTVVAPTLPTNYAGANYFTGNPNGTTGSEHNGSVGTSYTHTAYSAAGVNGITVGGYQFMSTVTLDDAAVGDVFLQGYIDGPSVATVIHGFKAGDLSGWTNGDFYQDGYVAGYDVADTISAFKAGGDYGVYAEGSGPSVVFGPAALVGGSAVPEPASLGLLSLGALSLMRRRPVRRD
jgi:hypothetical protein